jgi:hypothetical protein
MVYVITFSSDVCSKMYSVVADMANASVQLDEEIIQGSKAIGNSDQMQKLEEALYTTNYGATVPQPQ